jgi:hypothetical protein
VLKNNNKAARSTMANNSERQSGKIASWKKYRAAAAVAAAAAAGTRQEQNELCGPAAAAVNHRARKWAAALSQRTNTRAAHPGRPSERARATDQGIIPAARPLPRARLIKRPCAATAFSHKQYTRSHTPAARTKAFSPLDRRQKSN